MEDRLYGRPRTQMLSEDAVAHLDHTCCNIQGQCDLLCLSNRDNQPWLMWFSLLEHRPVHQRVVGSIAD